MKIRHIFALFIVLAAGAVAVLAQDCPKVMTTSASEPVKSVTPLTFTSTVSGGDPNVTPTYNWTISAGTITSGQGTSVIIVDTTGVEGSITATVDVGGFDGGCSTASSSTSDVEKPKESRKFAELVKPSTEEQNLRVEDFLMELGTDPSSTGYVFAYASKDSPTAAKQFLKTAQAKAATIGFDLSRLMLKEGGLKSAFGVEMWIVPEGLPAPKPNPPAAPAPRPAPKGKKA
jgi:hypothetical protein